MTARWSRPSLSIIALCTPLVGACATEPTSEVSSRTDEIISDHIGYWAFDETTGTVAEDAYTGTPDDGTLYDGETIDNGPSWTSAGKVDGAVTFDGSNDNVRIGDSGYGPSFTVAFWFKVSDNSGGHGTFFSHGTAYSANSLMIRMAGSGNGSIWTYLCDSLDTSCTTGEGTSGNWGDGTWHHYALVVSSTTDDGKIYLDGTLTDTFAKGGDTINPAGLVHVGRRNDGNYPLKGSMDELRLFNRALSATEVGELVAYTTLPAVPTDHIGYWKLDETSGNIANDEYAGTPDDGTRYEGTTVGQGPIWTNPGGRIDGALTFDGVNDNLQIGDSGFGPDFSVAFWFKGTDVSGAHGTLWSHGTAYAANSLMIRIAGSGSGSLWTYLCDSADTSCSGGVGVDGNWGDGVWHHYVLTVSNTQDTSKVYVDGQFKVNVPKGGSTIDPSGLIFVGRRNDGQYPFEGAMDELRLYDRELSAAEVDSLYGYPDGGDEVDPTVAMTAPTEGATLSGSVTLSATASDDGGIARVEFYVDGTQVGAADTTAPYSIVWDSTTVPDGAYGFTAKAFDHADNSAITTGVNAFIDNPTSTIDVVTRSGTTEYPPNTDPALMNPERGWYYGVSPSHSVPPADITNVRSKYGMTLALMLVDLRKEFEHFYADPDAVWEQDEFPAGLETALRAALDDARAMGFKIIFRFRYRKDEGRHEVCDPPPNDDNCWTVCDYDDPELARVQEHIEEMGPIFEEYKDVIAMVHAGWVGPWGEFNQVCPAHLIADGVWDDVIDKALEVVPEGRFLSIRTPDRKDDYLHGAGDDDYLLSTEAFTNVPQARLAHYNDCILVNEWDQGTYDDADWYDYVEEDSKYTPWGGETCPLWVDGVQYPSGLHDCVDSEPVLRARHMSYLNSQYAQTVVNFVRYSGTDTGFIDDDTDPYYGTGVWVDQGCHDEITRDMGYRFTLDYTQHSVGAPKGHKVNITVKLSNLGYAAMYNERPMYVVLKSSDGATKYKAPLTTAATDPRHWLPYGEIGQVTISQSLKLPDDARETTYTIALWMPEDIRLMPQTSTYINVMKDPKFAVQLATTGTWQSSTGYNVIGTNFVIGSGQDANPGTGTGELTVCTDCP